MGSTSSGISLILGPDGELAEGGDGFDEFMTLDVSDLLTDSNIDMPSHENIQSYLSSRDDQLRPFYGNDIIQETQISSNHDGEYNNYDDDELENNLNSVQPATSLNSPSEMEAGLLDGHDHKAAAAQAENALPKYQNMSSSLHQHLSRSSTDSSIQGCAPIYVDTRNNHFGGPSQNKAGVTNVNSSVTNQQDSMAWFPQSQNSQSGPRPWRSNSHSLQPQPQKLDQATVTPTVIAASPPLIQMRLEFGPQESQFQRLANQAGGGCNVLNPNEGGQQIQIVVSIPRDVHLQVLPINSSGPEPEPGPRPGFSGLNGRPSNQIQIIVNSGLQGVLQPQGSMPTPIVHMINPIQETFHQQNQFMPTDQQGIGLNVEVSVPQQLEESSRAQNQFRRLAQHAHPRPQMELGESSTHPRKRVARRDHQLQLPQQVSDIFQPQGTETRDNKRRALNHLYDPLYEGTGLPIDPHLRRFVASKKEENDTGSTMSHGD